MVLTPWLRSLSIRSARVPRRPRRKASGSGFVSHVEHLEDRTLLAVGTLFVPSTGTLIVATDTSDDVAITAGPGGEVLINGANPQTGPLQASQVRAISVSGGQGANNIDLSGVLMADFVMLPAGGISVDGDDGADTITASEIGGFYSGEHGDDLLIGSTGNDTLDGDDGNDTILGLAGDDVLIGEDGNDSIDGGAGDDTILAGDGEDLVSGNDGNDSIEGGNGLDTLNGDAGDDFINAGFNDDQVDGGAGNDTIFGGGGHDVLNGGDGDDQINGQAGRETVNGDAGNDSLLGGFGNDLILGGDGDDTLNGEEGDDSIDGNAGNDLIDGGADNDSLNGGDGNDNLSGGTGDDFINGDLGDDVIAGNAGSDTIIGGGGADSLDGGAGNDIVQSVPPSINITDVTVQEGDSGTRNAVFNVTLSTPSILPVTVNFASTDGTATAGSDYIPVSGTLVFQPGELSKMISVQIIGDTDNEPDETFFVDLTNATGAAILDGQGMAVILDDDLPLPTLTIGDAFVTEGDMGMTTQVIVSVTLSGVASQDVTVDFTTMDGTAMAGSDYTMVSGTLTFPVGTLTQTITIPILGDDINEGIETFLVNLMNVTNAIIADNSATVSILDDDGFIGLPDAECDPTLPSVGTSHVLTSGTGDGTITLTISGSGDFDEVSGSGYNPVGPIPAGSTIFDSDLYFRANLTTGARMEVTAVSGVEMFGDSDEATSMFQFGGLDWVLCQQLQLTQDTMGMTTGSLFAQTYEITNNTGSQVEFELVRYLDGDLSFDGTISDGGGRLVTMAGDEILFETDAGGTGATDTTFVGITALRGTDTATNRFEVDSFNGVQTRIQNGTALDDMIVGDNDMDGFIDAGSEYDVTLGLRTTYMLPAGMTATFTTHTIWGSGAPMDVTPPPVIPDISITDVTVTEGDVGTTNAIFNVNLSAATSEVVTVNYTTANDTATAGVDYQMMSGTLTFMPGQTTQQISTPVNGDTTVEPDETFFVNLSNAMNGNIADAQGVGTILNDDVDEPPPPPTADEDDTLFGGTGDDTIFGGPANDLIVGGEGNDFINGGAGDDTISGGAGRDTISGSDGNDLLDGGRGTDVVNGDMGNDTITWESFDGSDEADGGLGFDEMQVRTLSHNDRITVGAVGDGSGRFFVQHRIPSDPAGDTVRGGMIEVLSIDSDGGADRITIEDLTGVQWLQQVNVDAGRGSDIINATAQANDSIMISLMGGEGADTVISGAGNDFIDGGAGNDSLMGGAGDDTINGGMGVDRIHGGDGDDVLSGNNGRDFLYGEAGNDTLDGGNQNDDLYGGTGRDLLFGAAGDDSLLGEAHEDTLFGGDGNDTLRGGTGDDEADGEAGVDSVDGGAGNDILRGGADSDTVVGGDGDDVIFGGNGLNSLLTDGDDFLNGNAGNDTILGERGQDTLLGGAGHDDLDGGFGHDQLNGNSGDDTMRGGDGDDLMRGGMGNDTLNGGHGEDTLHGEDGDDALSGHDGHDRLNGGGGNDTLHGGDGDDTLRGGSGLDLLIGHDGQDDLDGQGGDPDTLVGQDAFDILDDNGGLDTVDNSFIFTADWIDAI